MVNPEHRFHLIDFCIFGVTIIVSLGIGLYYALSGGKQRTTSEYFVGNRRMAIIPVAISLMVSFESSIMMLGTPAEVYVYGLQWFIGNLGFFFANIISIIVVVPLVHPLKITSAYEYLELRFSAHRVRILGTILGMLSYTCYMGIVLFGPAIALEAVTGFPQWTSIVCIAVASGIYTAIGGLKAVIWTDVFQCVVMFTGFFAVLIKGTMQIGGIGKTWEIAYEKGRVNLFNFDTDPTIRHTFWNLFVGSIIRGFGLVFNQSSIQRISSTPTVGAAQKVLALVAPGFFLSLTLAGIEGIIAYAYYDTLGCDPLASDQIANPNQIVPYMVMDIFKGLPGMPGLFMASLFSASLSTLSSGLSSLSALFWADLVKPHVKPMSELKATIISKLSVLVFGGLAVMVAFLIALVGGTLIQITGSILSAFGGPLSGLFMFGAFCPWGNDAGAFYGTILSTIFTFVICLGQMMTKGAVKNTKLPSGPTDFCPVDNSSAIQDMVYAGLANMTSYLNMTSSNETYFGMNNGTMSGMMHHNYHHSLNDTITTILTTTEATEMTPEPEGFSRLFMLSYQWFGGVGIIQVFVYGTIISLCTGYKKPGEVPRKYLIPFYDSLFPFLPECMLKVLRCGYEYPEDKKKGDDGTEYHKINDGSDDARLAHEFDIEPAVDACEKGEPGLDTTLLTTTTANGIRMFDSDIVVTAQIQENGIPQGQDEKPPQRGGQTLADDDNVTEKEQEARIRNLEAKLNGYPEVAKSVDNLQSAIKVPTYDVEMNIMRADSLRGSAGFIVVENSADLTALQLRAKSVEMDIMPM